MKEKNKIGLGSFDFIKGIAVLIIIYGHIIRSFDLSKLTWFQPSFIILDVFKTPLIPLFFIVSGYGFKNKSVVKIWKKTIKTLLLPYGFVMIGFCLFQPLSTYLQNHNLQKALTDGIRWGLAFLLGIPEPGKIIFGYKLANCSIVWFLLALFWAHNILNVILKCKKNMIQVFTVVGCAIIGYILCVLEVTYFCIPQGLIATSYLYFGYRMKEGKLLEKDLPHKWMYGVCGIIALIYSRIGYFDLCYGDFTFFPMDYVGVSFLAFLLLKLGIRLGRLKWKMIGLINEIGVYSYWIICIHSLEQKCIPWNKFAALFAESQNLGFILALGIKAMIIASGCMLLRKVGQWKYERKKRKIMQKQLYSKVD